MPGLDDGDSKQALLDDLQALRKMLNEDLASRASQRPGSANHRHESGSVPTQIPLLQDVFDPEHPEQEIQIEQLRPDSIEPRTTGSLFDNANGLTGDEAVQSDVQSPQPPEHVYTQAAVDPERDTGGDSADLAALYTEYLDQHMEQGDPLPATIKLPMQGFSRTETEEFLELLIDEHAEEILALVKDVLKDRLSLLVTQVRDSHSITLFDDSNLPDPDSSDQA